MEAEKCVLAAELCPALCMELKESFRPSLTAAAMAAADGVRRGMGEEIAESLLGLGGGRRVLSNVGVPIRAGFEKIFILDPSFLAGGGV